MAYINLGLQISTNVVEHSKCNLFVIYFLIIISS